MATQDRGFASMDKQKQKEISRKGGQAQSKQAKSQGGKNSHGEQS